jgi:diadenosine tetraphosphate (Ap4A) HIT family hydrolase
MIAKNDMFTLEQSPECAVPGYLVLRLKSGETSLAELAPEKARALGGMLARAAKAIEAAVGAERVYVLSFCEVDRRLHFHLFPRTAWLLDEYARAGAGASGPVDGPMLFSWARQTYARPGDLPGGVAGPDAVGAGIRASLEQGA